MIVFENGAALPGPHDRLPRISYQTGEFPMFVNGIFIPTSGAWRQPEKRRWWEWIIVVLIVVMAYGLFGALFFSAL